MIGKGKIILLMQGYWRVNVAPSDGRSQMMGEVEW